MKKREQNRDYVQCPMCNQKHYMNLNDIPKSLIIIQLIDTKKGLTLPNASNNATNTKQPYPNNTYKPTAPVLPPPPPSYNSLPTPYMNQQQYSINQNHSVPQNYYQPSVQSYNTSVDMNNNRTPQTHHQPWDPRSYLRNIFKEMDLNGDGSITAVELQRALRRSLAGSEFSIKTVELLIAKYDVNGDKEISFEEFFDLFNSLNEEYENFLMMDTDGSGSIDQAEFTDAIMRKGHEFSHEFFKYIMDEVYRKTGQYGIQFDNYIRIAARFEFLCKTYKNTPYYHKHPLESYLKKTFFQDFW